MPKHFYSIGELARMLGEAVSTIRYWEQEFPHLAPKHTSPKGTRQYRAEEIEQFRAIKYLLREKKMTIQGAKQQISQSKRMVVARSEILHRLREVLSDLRELEKHLDTGKHSP